MTLKLAATVIATDAQTADLPTARRWADQTRAKVKMKSITTRIRRVLFLAEVSQKEGKKERELLNKLLINRLAIPVSFSLGPEDAPVFLKFCEIARREEGVRGRSRVFVKAMAEYNQRHEEGNPQLKIATYLPTAEKSPVRVLCAFLNGATSEGRVHCTRYGGSWVLGVKCYSCSSNQLRKKTEGVSS
jgi:hypothetical protein